MTSSDRGWLKRAVVTSALLASVAGAGNARADTDEQKAVTLFEKGRRLARDQRCAEAIAPFLESIRYAEGVGPLLNLGACYETLGKTASAYKYFTRAEKVAAERSDKRRDEAAQRAKAIERDLSTLTIRIPPMIRAGAEVKVDGEPWPRERWNNAIEIDPGPHTIEMTSPQAPKQSETLQVGPKADHVEWSAPVLLSGPKAATEDVPPSSKGGREQEEAGSTQQTLGYVAAGAGGLGLVIGSVFGLMAINRHSEVTGRCPTYPRCSAADRAFLDEANSGSKEAGTLSLVGFVAGAALLATGIVLLTTAPKSRAKSAAAR